MDPVRFVPSSTVGRRPAQGEAFEVQELNQSGKWELVGWVQQSRPGGTWSGLALADANVGSYGRWARPAASRIGAWHFAETRQY